MRLQAAPVQTGERQVLAATCQASDAVGDVVYITGDKVGNLYQVTRVDIDTIATVPAIGIILLKSTSTACVVQTEGLVTGLYTGLTPQKPLFISTTGRLTHTVTPHPTVGRRAHQMMGQALGTTVLLLNIKSPIILVA